MPAQNRGTTGFRHNPAHEEGSGAAHRDSPAGFALQENKPVISPDTDTEVRFEIPGLLVELGVKSIELEHIMMERTGAGTWAEISPRGSASG